MTTTTIPDYNLEVEHPEGLAFMYSRTPLTVRGLTNTIDLKVTHVASGRSYVESRKPYSGEVSFDLATIMRYLAPDVTGVLSAARGGLGASETFAVSLEIVEEPVLSFELFGIYGALNAAESYRPVEPLRPETRRLWVNYPQTVTTQKNAEGYVGFNINKAFVDLHITGNFLSYEVDLLQALKNDSRRPISEALEDLLGGISHIVELTSRYSVDEKGEVFEQDKVYFLKLQPDLTPVDAPGRTYLRWLQRDGSVGYWLFHTGELQVAAAQGSTFVRFFNNPNAPSSSAPEFANNSRQADFTESRTLNLGTTVNNLDEFEYLAGLMTSPVVDRYIKVGDSYGWQRVNVTPSTQAYNRKRDTPYVRQIELTIQLPDRDTIKL